MKLVKKFKKEDIAEDGFLVKSEVPAAPPSELLRYFASILFLF